MSNTKPKLTPYQRIVRAAYSGRGVRLSAEEARQMGLFDAAIIAVAQVDDENVNGSSASQVALATGGSHIESEERDANARLIAAAPDLLAACEMARRVVDPMAQESSAKANRPWDPFRASDEAAAIGVNSALRSIEAAIEKATSMAASRLPFSGGAR